MYCTCTYEDRGSNASPDARVDVERLADDEWDDDNDDGHDAADELDDAQGTSGLGVEVHRLPVAAASLGLLSLVGKSWWWLLFAIAIS